MKLRLDKNSVRLRLKKSDVKILQDHHSIGETIIFPNGTFTFRLSLDADTVEITTSLQHQSLEVTVPFRLAEHWMSSDETGLYHTISNTPHSLDIIIEKDFPCKDRKEEDLSDFFAEDAAVNSPKPC